MRAARDQEQGEWVYTSQLQGSVDPPDNRSTRYPIRRHLRPKNDDDWACL
jgi:hypothetical protein